MRLSTRSKFWLLTSFVIIIGFTIKASIFGLDAKYDDYVFFGWILIGAFLMCLVKCPRCGTPVVFQGKFGRVPLVAAFVNSKCKKCDFDLSS